MSISKMYHKDVSYKLALEALAQEYINAMWPKANTLTLYSIAHTLAVTMGLVTALVLEDLKKEVNKLSKAA